MNKLTRLTIKKFRNVAPTTLEFRPGINVLLGRNAAGKTTLLRLLSILRRTPDVALLDDPLEVHYHTAGKSVGIEHTITKTRGKDFHLPFVTGRHVREDPPSLQQTDSFIIERNGLVVRADLLPNSVMIEQAGKQTHFPRLYFSDPITPVVVALLDPGADSTWHELAIEFLSSEIKTAGRMDESLERFDALLKLEIQIEDTVSSWSINELPVSFFEMLPSPIPEGTAATFSPLFLDRVARVLGYESATVRFDIERLSPEPSRHIVRLSNPRFFFKRLEEEVSHDRLSYGQKRLLAFFAHADASPDVIIADELVNGLHHEWISACLDEIGERQAFLTSQNPLLLDFLRFDSAEEVRQSFILCERTSNEAGAQLIWRNPTQDEAESFFLAYQTGIQRVSDILLTKGLW